MKGVGSWVFGSAPAPVSFGVPSATGIKQKIDRYVMTTGQGFAWDLGS